MLLELAMLLVCVLAMTGIIMGLLAFIYGRNRPTKILGKIVPGILIGIFAFYVLGRYGIKNIPVAAAVFVLAGAGFFINFLWTAKKLTLPINRIAYGLSAGGEALSAAARNVRDASQALAEGASEHAAGLEETSSSLEEISSMTKRNAENSFKGQSMMGEVDQVLEAVAGCMTEMSKSIHEITSSSEETSKIIKTIDDIAFQTNLLALNAAVEAARAGEAGAGFAVVASEVRGLAVKAAEAARITNDLIERTIGAVHRGAEATSKTVEVFNRNVAVSQEIKQIIDEMAEASKEQSEGISQVNVAVAEMDKITQQSASRAEELARTASNANGQAEKLREYVDDLTKLFGAGTKGSPDDAKKLMKGAVAYLKRNGTAEALREFSDQKGRFIDRDLYVVIYDRTGTIRAHPWNKGLIGQNMIDRPDQKGKLFRKEIIGIALNSGRGSVDYDYMNPVNQKVENKTAYFQRCGDLIVSIGAYR
ncbi:MAG: cache domain-containing protein [Deltaproteobacteria bacterium]|nr:cache domain-containing protein [Deltaproteobacteria bacterium]